MNPRVTHGPQLGFNRIERDRVSAQPVAGLGEGESGPLDARDRIVFDNPLHREGIVGVNQKRFLFVWRQRLVSCLAQADNVIVQPLRAVFLEACVVYPVLRMDEFLEHRIPGRVINFGRGLLR